jgi:LPXTG-site transpeptidase (sortase) family protein
LYTVDDPTGGSNPVNAGRRVTFPLGTLTNSSTGNAGLVFTYRVVVLDSAGNVDGKNLPNNAVFAWDGGSLSASTIVSVVEPNLTINKIADTTVVSLGSTVTFTLQIQHTASSHTNAYDTVIEDPLPPELDYVAGSLDCTGGAQDPDVACEYITATRTIRAEWSNFALGGGNGLIRFQARVTAIPAGGIENAANVSWTSLPGTVPGPLSPYNPQYSHERFHDPGSAVDIYFAQTRLRLNASAGITAAGVSALPATGFAPGRRTDLSHIPYTAYHTAGELRLIIPTLGVSVPVLGIPLEQGNWNTAWLSNQAGWLEGTAFPTWTGNSVLTGHTYLANGLPGPFLELESLRWGDQIIIQAFGSKYIYEVRSNQLVTPRNISILQHEDHPWLTLITCKGYDEDTDTYRWRVVVRAVLVNAE